MSDTFDFDDFDDEHDPFIHDVRKVCASCGTSGLQWQDFGSGWKLYDNNLKRHVCPQHKPSADDFNDLT